MTTTQTKRLVAIGAASMAWLGLLSSAQAQPRAPAAGGKKAASVPASDDNTRLRSLFRKGSAAFRAGKNEDARGYLLEAWAIRQTYDVASSLAQVEIELGQYRDAAEHLDFCLRHFAPVESEDTLKQVQKAFADAKQRVAALKIRVDEAGAEVFVDGLQIGTEPLPGLAFVEAGERRIAARVAGRTAERSIRVNAGNEYAVDLVLSSPQAEQPAVSSAPPPVSSTNASASTGGSGAARQSASYVPAIVAASVGGAALISSVVFLVRASRNAEQRDERLAELPGTNQCGANNPTAEACVQISSLNDDARTARTLSYVGFGVTAAAAVGTYLLWPRASQNSALGIRVLALPTSAGLSFFSGLDGRF